MRTVPYPNNDHDGAPADGWDEVWSSREFGTAHDGRYFAMREDDRWTIAVDPHFRGGALDVWLEGTGAKAPDEAEGDCSWLDGFFGWAFLDWCQGVPLAEVLEGFIQRMANDRPHLRVTWRVDGGAE